MWGEWENWKRASGVLCARKMKLKMTENVNQTVVRPTLMSWTHGHTVYLPKIIGFVLQDESNVLPR